MKGEINLLPRLLAKKRERVKYLIGLGRLLQRVALLLVLLIIGELVVLAGFMYVYWEVERASNGETEGDKVISEVDRVNKALVQIKRTRESNMTWSLYIEEVLQDVPAAVKIRTMMVKEDEAVLVVEGYSSSRNVVLGWQRVLERLSWAERIDAPLQNFALHPGSSFSFDILVGEKK